MCQLKEDFPQDLLQIEGHFHGIRSSIYIKEQKTVTICLLESVKYAKIIRLLTLLALEQT